MLHNNNNNNNNNFHLYCALSSLSRFCVKVYSASFRLFVFCVRVCVKEMRELNIKYSIMLSSSCLACLQVNNCFPFKSFALLLLLLYCSISGHQTLCAYECVCVCVCVRVRTCGVTPLALPMLAIFQKYYHHQMFVAHFLVRSKCYFELFLESILFLQERTYVRANCIMICF